MTGKIEPSGPREMQRSYGPSSPASAKPSNITYVFFSVAARRCASGVVGGRRPSRGSTRSDACFDALPHSSQCDGGPVPSPCRGAVETVVSASASSRVVCCFRRASNSSCVTSLRSPRFAGRSNGTPTMSVLGQIPARSGSPHAVFGGVYAGFCCANAAAARSVDNASAMEIRLIVTPVVVQTFRSAVIGRPEGLHYICPHPTSIDRLPLRRFLLGDARGLQNSLNPFVALVARVLEHRLAVVAREQHTERPWPHPRVRIVER